MTTTKKAWIAAGVAILFSLGLIVWQVKARRGEAVNLTAEDMALIAEDQSPQFRARLASDEAARKDFAENIRSAGGRAMLVGGSVRDEEVIAAADEQGVAMMFTGVRHFRH